jgi:hypothetical protein
MTAAELYLLILAFAFMTAGICHLVISIKRMAQRAVSRLVSNLLNGCAESVR